MARAQARALRGGAAARAASADPPARCSAAPSVPTSLQHSTKLPREKSPQSTPQTLKGSSKIEEATTTAAQASPKPAESEEGAGELDTFTKMSDGDICARCNST